MPIHIYIELAGFKLKQPAALKRWLKSVIETEGRKAGELNYILTSDKQVLNINNQYLKHNYFTDIITFNLSEGSKVEDRRSKDKKDVARGTISGEIYISIERVNDNARRYKVSEDEELRRVMVHGVLHLLGYNDKTATQSKVMRAKENYYLGLFEKG